MNLRRIAAARRALAAAAALVLTAVPAGAGAAETLRIHHFLSPASVTHAQFLLPWAERVERASGGQVRFDIYPAMQLGGAPRQLFDQARDGVADLTWTLPGYTAGRFPIVEVFELPFVGGSAEATSLALTAFQTLHLRAEFADVHPVLLHAHAPASFHMVDKRIARMSDLAGVKMRAPSRAVAAALQALGAVPVGMPVPEVHQAMARGVVDGAAIPFEVALPLRIHEVARTHTLARLYTGVFLLAMNKARYAALPDAARAAIDGESGAGLARRIGRLWDAAEEPGRAAATARGNEIVDLAADERARWIAATRPVIDAWIADMDKRGYDGAGLLADARRLIAEFEAARGG